MACANSFVKNELQETLVAYTPSDGIYNVLDPCSRCEHFKAKAGGRRWEHCMRERRRCFRKGEDHPLPTIRRVHVDNLSEDRDFACVFENDGGETITWDKRTTRCRIPCDRCWSLAQCTRMRHALDPCNIPFLDIDDAPGVTPAKRSCKSANPLCSSKTPRPGGGSSREPKLARRKPTSSPSTRPQADTRPSPPTALNTPSPCRPPSRLPVAPMPAVPVAEAGSAAVPPRSSPPSSGDGRASGNVSGGGGGGSGSGGSGGGGGDPLPGAASTVCGQREKDKGKRLARKQSSRGAGAGETAGVGNDLRSTSPEAAAGAGAGAAEAEGPGSGRSGSGGAGAGADGGGGAGVDRAGTGTHFPKAGRGSDVLTDTLREQVESAAGEVQKAVEHLRELDKVKVYASAQIRDWERLLKSTKIKEQQVQKLVDDSKSKEAQLKRQLKGALAGTAAKLKQEAAQLEREAELLP
eukprot:g11628.t2